MSRRTVTVELSAAGIDRATAEVKKYRGEIQRKLVTLQRKIAERVAWKAANGFSTALADDWITGSAPSADVKVQVTTRGNISTVFTQGDDAVFIEFGAGVANNGGAGTSPHPKGGELGMIIGEYGKGYGKKRVWGYYDADGELRLTRGTPAAMPMYRAVRDACNVIRDLATEVFGV